MLVKDGLVHNYHHGVVIVFPHQKSHEGQSRHWEKEKEEEINKTGVRLFNIRLIAEHHELEAGLDFLNLPHLEHVPKGKRYPDDCYICDAVIVAGDRVLYTRMGGENREKEPSQMRPFFQTFTKKEHRLKKPGVFEGGDSITFRFNGWWYSLIGRREEDGDIRTNAAGREQFTKFLQRALRGGFAGSLIGDHSALHIGTAMELIQRAPGETLWIIHNRWLKDPERLVRDLTNLLGLQPGQVKAFQVPEGKDWWAPVLNHNDKVLMQSGCPELRLFLEQEGFEVMEINWYYHQLTSGNLRCAIQPLPTKRWFTEKVSLRQRLHKMKAARKLSVVR